jgi:uncharacterized repeat protein (TIGR02543 family)
VGSCRRPQKAGGTGGKGGQGGYISGYTYLKKGSALSITVGSVGGVWNSGALWGSNGAGGGYSAIKNGETPLLVAAGGNGGGNADVGRDGADGTNGFVNPNATGTGASTSILADLTGYNGIPGNNDDEANTATPNNYHNSDIINKSGDGSGLTASVTGFTSNKPSAVGSNGAVIITCLQVDTTKQGSIPRDYSFLSRIDKYWDVIDVTVKGANDSEIVTDAAINTVKGTTTIDSNDSESDFADCTLIKVEHFSPGYNETTGTDDNGTPLTVYTSKITVIIDLKPKAAFLGGNDVPILVCEPAASGADHPILYGMQMRQTAPSNGAGDDLLNLDVPSKEVTDYANVEISYTAASSDIQPGAEKDRTIDQTTAKTYIEKADLYKWENTLNWLDGPDGDFRDDFVTKTETVVKTETGVEETGSTIAPVPLVTTLYTVTVGLAPTVKEPQAVFTSPVSAVTVSKDIEVIVLPRIQYNLTNLTMSGTDAAEENYAVTGAGSVTIAPGRDNTATLKAAGGYILPTSITVTAANGSDISDQVGYNASTGGFTIPSEYAVGTITVQAAATAKTYSVTYYYYPTPESTTAVMAPGGTYAAGVPLAETPPAVTDIAGDGYNFAWDWGDGATEMPSVMPARNLIVIGRFTPEQHKLTIHYQYAGGAEAAESHEETLAYGADYQVTSPLIDGYTADTVMVSGTMGLSDVTVTVTYTKNTNQLTIYYFFRDGSQANEPYTETITIGHDYTITSPTVNYHTPDKAVISGSMDNDGATYYVYYDPNTYTVTFDMNCGGELSNTTRTVQYGKTYAYDAASDATLQLPAPSRSGYTFLGWTYEQEPSGEPVYVKATDPINAATANDHTLYAQWAKSTVTVTIRYILDDAAGTLIDFDDAPKNPLELIGEIGNEYVQESPVYGDYTPSKQKVEGIFSENTTIVVVYTAPKTYTVTVYYLWKEHAEDEYVPHPTFETIRTAGLKSGATFSYASPVLDGYTCTLPTVAGTITDSDLTFWVYYYPTPVTDVVSVTVEWGSLVFNHTYGAWQSDEHTYASDTIEPESSVANRILVTNTAASTISVTASFTYANDDAKYPGLQGSFVDEYDTEITELSLAPGGVTGKAYLNISGTLDRELNETQITSGVCTVTITGGG